MRHLARPDAELLLRVPLEHDRRDVGVAHQMLTKGVEAVREVAVLEDVLEIRRPVRLLVLVRIDELAQGVEAVQLVEHVQPDDVELRVRGPEPRGRVRQALRLIARDP